MLNSSERINFISDYIGSYETKIKLLNKNGLFDAAKLFELFAQEVCQLWFGKSFHNLNETKPNYPYVDLLSDDSNIYVQVSTSKDLPTKIKSTLEKIKEDKKKQFKDLKQVYFFVLNNESIAQVKDFSGVSKIGNVDFIKEKHLITTQNVLARAMEDINFQKELFELLYNEVTNIRETSNRLFEEIENSKSVGLNNIDSLINDEYEIDRSQLIKEICSCTEQFISVRGEAGSGKSVLCKKIVENEQNILYARAERFTEETNIDDIWHLNINVALNYLNEKKIIIFIDSLEFIADAKQTKLDLFQTLFEIVKKHSNAKIITSCRTSDETAFFKIDSKYRTHSFYLELLTPTELQQISLNYPIIKPFLANTSYASLIKTPFYVNLIVKNIKDTSSITDENKLRDIIWENVICLKEKVKNFSIPYSEIVKTVKFIALERAKQFSVGINKNDINSNIYNILLSEGVIVENSTTIRLKYDIFEDICFEKEFDYVFETCKGNYNKFFNEIEQYGRCVYRRYQIWLSNKILTKSNRKKFLYKLIFTKDISSKWNNQTIIGLIKSDYCKSFFDEYSYNILNEGLIQTFIDITNLYGFEMDLSLSDIAPIILIKPKGKGREELIKIIYDNELYIHSELSAITIQKICSDYAKSKSYDCNVANIACKILQKYLEEKIEDEKFYLHKAEETLNSLLNPIYQMSEFSKNWIKEFWKIQKNNLISDITIKKRVSEEIIKYTLKFTTTNLAKYLPFELCDLAEYFWTTKLPEYHPFAMEKDDICYAFGLNRHAEYYGKFDALVIKNRFFPNLLNENFYIALDWAINFINKSFDYLSEQENVQLPKETIYFTEENKKQDYYLYNQIWLAGQHEYVLPTIIGDIVYLLRNKIIELTKSLIYFKRDYKSFVDEIKERIFKNSNSIVLFTIIEDLGILFIDILPGFALDLTTNINIILFDIERYTYNHPSEIQKSLEQSIYSIAGIPNIQKRYNPKYHIDITLQNYFLEMQFVDECKDRCIKILDYLYSIIPNDADHASMYLQIQKMDFRNPVVEQIDDKYVSISPRITGEAKKTVDDNIQKNKPKEIIEIALQEFYENFDIKNYQLNEVLKCIDIYYENIKNIDLRFQYDRHIVLLFAYALNKPELEKNLRDKFCNELVDGVEIILENGNFQFDYPLLVVLFRQIDENASVNTKIRIKKLILSIVTDNQNNGLISKLNEVTKLYLKENLELSKAVFNTIIMLAKDKNVKTNHFVIKKHPFIKTSGNVIKKYKLIGKIQTLNNSNTEQILRKYLIDATNLDISHFDISHYNIQILYHIINCGLDLTDNNIEMIIKEMVKLILDNLNSKEQIFSRDRISQAKNAITNFLSEELFLNTDIVLNILFDDIDFSCFSDESIDFYLKIFNRVLPIYVDSYNDRVRRDLCEKIIYSLEDKIEKNVCSEYVKKKLYRALFLSVRGFEGDWDKVKTDYSFADIQFLNKMFSLYGKYDVEYFMRTIYQMKLDKLLPHILPSIKSVIESVVKENSNDKTCLDKVEDIVNQLITVAFLNFSDEIKQDLELTDAFENILQILVNLSYPLASVILDEFRIH